MEPSPYKQRMLLLEAAYNALQQKARELGMTQEDLQELEFSWSKPPLSLAMILQPINWEFVEYMDKRA